MYPDFSREPEPKIVFTDTEPEDEGRHWSESYKIFRGSWIGKLLLFLILPIIIFNLVFLRYDDFVNGCHIEIGFSLLEFNNLEIKRSLKFIRNVSPDDYENVCRYVKNIELYLPCSQSAGGCFRDAYQGKIGVNRLRRDNQDRPSFTAGIIVHETCHAIQSVNGQIKGNREEECYRAGYAFLKRAGVEEDDIPKSWKSYNQ